MAMGKRKQLQDALFTTAENLPRSAGHRLSFGLIVQTIRFRYRSKFWRHGSTAEPASCLGHRQSIVCDL